MPKANSRFSTAPTQTKTMLPWQHLSFVTTIAKSDRTPDGPRVNHWNVTPSGCPWTDCLHGAQLARQYLAFCQETVERNQFMPDLAKIVADMKTVGAVEMGFLDAVIVAAVYGLSDMKTVGAVEMGFLDAVIVAAVYGSAQASATVRHWGASAQAVGINAANAEH